MSVRDEFSYAKSPEQFEDPAGFDALREDEFPHRKSLLDVDRRELLKFMGGTLALAGLASGCRYLPQQKIVPFVQAPENRLPGEETHFATACETCGFGTGVLVRSYEGRPVKIEGNPNHPASMGATDARTQAELAVMYDPSRLQLPQVSGDFGGWNDFVKRARAAISAAHDGAGVAILTQNVGSPTLAAQIKKFLKAHPGAKWFQYEPVNQDNVVEGSKLAFGQPVESVYDFSQADVVVGLDADLFQDGPSHVRAQRDIMARRAVDRATGAMSMNRLYAIEGVPTLFGACADHRWRVRSSKILDVAKALLASLGGGGAAPAGTDAKKWAALVSDLQGAGGKAVVVAGQHQPAGVHAVAHAINAALGSVGKVVSYTRPVYDTPANNGSDIKNLTSAMKSQQVSFLLLLDGNPVLDAPSDLKFGEALASVPLSAHLTLVSNETSQACTWQLPMSHFLESWGDTRAYDGTASVVQPLISPVFDTKSSIELMDALNGQVRAPEDPVRQTWQAVLSTDAAWEKALSTGVVAGTRSPAAAVSLVPGVAEAVTGVNGNELELLVLPDPNIYDGRYFTIGWLQELPKPLTNITWDNTFQMSPATAKKLGVGQQDRMLGVPFYGNWTIVKVTANGRTVEGPVYVHYGMADDQIVVHTGYGRKGVGTLEFDDPVRKGGGFDAYPLTSSNSPIFVSGVVVEKTGKDYKLANTQFHNTLDVDDTDSKRDIIRETTLVEFTKNHEALKHPTEPTNEIKGEEREQTSIFEGPPGFNESDQYQWAMTVDLNLCTGCNACVTACQAENNIPVVGKEQVLRHRMMHWIRIDRYYRKPVGKAFDENDPIVTFQPVACVQCEKAPCEPVCPVAATTHSHEGLNQMVYNRCVGTRYCSNNCPYKVRRFNYLHYTRPVEDAPLLKLLQNPDVSVRGRGVMEKCTYCVQRIDRARIEAKKKGERLKDGEVVTACQQACPSKAIVFGDMTRPESAVSKSRGSDRNYMLLEVLNTRPRTSYLGKVRNPNPEMEA